MYLVIKLRVDFLLNEMLKKVNYASICIEAINIKELDKKS
jgi:hypothetical protein